MRLALPFCLALVAGCASNSGVVPAGGDTLMIAKQAATGFGGVGNLKSDALTEASQHCVSKGKQLEVISATQNEGPYAFGKYPRAEVQFRCV